MTKYYPYGVSLSRGQLEKLSRAYNNNSAITIRLVRNELSGPHELMLTKTQINKLRKAMSQGTVGTSCMGTYIVPLLPNKLITSLFLLGSLLP